MNEVALKNVKTRVIRDDLQASLDIRVALPRTMAIRQQVDLVQPLCNSIVALLNTLPRAEGTPEASLMKVSEGETDKFTVVHLIFGGGPSEGEAREAMKTLAERVNSLDGLANKPL